MNYLRFFLLGFFLVFKAKKNVRRIKKYTIKQKNKISKKHEELKKKCKGEMYTVENSYGYFSVCVQTHFKYNVIGYASYYDWGHITATGENFSPNNYTAAHPYLPIPCVAEITSIDNPRKKIIVKINDRGPFIQNEKVIIDLTTTGAQELGFCYHGLLKVRVRVLVKETMMLSEYGGDVQWDGTCHFRIAVRASQVKARKKVANIKKSNKKINVKRQSLNNNKTAKKRQNKNSSKTFFKR